MDIEGVGWGAYQLMPPTSCEVAAKRPVLNSRLVRFGRARLVQLGPGRTEKTCSLGPVSFVWACALGLRRAGFVYTLRERFAGHSAPVRVKHFGQDWCLHSEEFCWALNLCKSLVKHRSQTGLKITKRTNCAKLYVFQNV